jgi:hypothetical protein
MSAGPKVESTLQIMVDDLEASIKSRLPDAIEIANRVDHFSDVRGLLAHCEQNPDSIEHIVSATAVAELFYTIKEGILADDVVDEEELEVTRELLSMCLYRYTWLDAYGRFEPLVDNEELKDLLGTWEMDETLLGGNFDGGAAVLPLAKLVMIVCILNQDISLHNRLTQMSLLVGKLIVATGGIEHGEREFLDNLSNQRDAERGLVLEYIEESSSSRSVAGFTSLRGTEREDFEEAIAPEKALQEAMTELDALIPHFPDELPDFGMQFAPTL